MYSVSFRSTACVSLGLWAHGHMPIFVASLKHVNLLKILCFLFLTKTSGQEKSNSFVVVLISFIHYIHFFFSP